MCPKAKKVLKNMEKDSRAAQTLQRRLDRCDAAKLLATTRKLRDIPAKDLQGHLQVLLEGHVPLPTIIQAKLAVYESNRMVEQLGTNQSKEDARKIAQGFAQLHDLSPATQSWLGTASLTASNPGGRMLSDRPRQKMSRAGRWIGRQYACC